RRPAPSRKIATTCGEGRRETTMRRDRPGAVGRDSRRPPPLPQPVRLAPGPEDVVLHPETAAPAPSTPRDVCCDPAGACQGPAPGRVSVAIAAAGKYAVSAPPW